MWYSIACGVYEARINGQKAGRAFLAPGWTSYHNRLQYQTYDVTGLLTEENEIKITVGNGWYKGELGFNAAPNRYGDRTALLAMLFIEYIDGEKTFIGTDTSWNVETGMIRFSEIYHGEIQNLTAETKPAGAAVLFDKQEAVGKIIAQESEPVHVTKRFSMPWFPLYLRGGGAADADAECFTACALHTDMQRTGNFVCDNGLVNQLQSNIEWGQRSNFLDIPTDCPQRDKRLGWTGDAQVFCGTASYNFNTALFFAKWLRDMAAETTREWGVPHTVPNILGQQPGAAAWSDAAVIIPWTVYQVYGDKKLLAEQAARALFEQAAPGMLDSPMVKFALDMPISEIVTLAPEMMPLCQTAVDTMNAQIREQRKQKKQKKTTKL